MAVMGVGYLFCVPGTDDIKKEQKPWNNTKQNFPEQKTKKSYIVLPHLCQVHEVLTGFWNH